MTAHFEPGEWMIVCVKLVLRACSHKVFWDLQRNEAMTLRLKSVWVLSWGSCKANNSITKQWSVSRIQLLSRTKWDLSTREDKYCNLQNWPTYSKCAVVILHLRDGLGYWSDFMLLLISINSVLLLLCMHWWLFHFDSMWYVYVLICPTWYDNITSWLETCHILLDHYNAMIFAILEVCT